MKKALFFLPVLLSILTIGVSACSPQANAASPTSTNPPPTTAAPASQSFTDPFAYCAAVGTIDAPDARYSGPQVPDEVINGYKKAAGLEASSEPLDVLKKTTIWRCMDGKVYACNFGANLSCNSKANTDKTPTQAIKDYCAANPDSDFVPMAVTGHSTIYSWHCVKGTPELLDQIGKVDAAGYLAQIWYAIEPNVPASAPPADSPMP